MSFCLSLAFAPIGCGYTKDTGMGPDDIAGNDRNGRVKNRPAATGAVYIPPPVAPSNTREDFGRNPELGGYVYESRPATNKTGPVGTDASGSEMGSTTGMEGARSSSDRNNQTGVTDPRGGMGGVGGTSPQRLDTTTRDPSTGGRGLDR